MEPLDDDSEAFEASDHGGTERSSPPPPPEQRSWRHPSEMASAVVTTLDTESAARAVRRREAVLAAGAGLLGAVAAGALLVLLLPGTSKGPALVAPLATGTPALRVPTTSTTTPASPPPDATVPLLASTSESAVAPWPTLTHSGATAVPLGTDDLLLTTEVGAGDGLDTLTVRWEGRGEVLATVVSRGDGVAVLQLERPVEGVDGVEWSDEPPSPGSWVTVWSGDRHRGVVVEREGGLALAGVADDDTVEGAPVLDRSGRLVGLCSRHRGTTVLIPVVDVRAALETRRPPAWMGVAVTTGRSDGTSAVVVTEVLPGGPAAQAGLQVDDVVVSFAGHAVDTALRLARHIEAHQPGEVVTIEVRRLDALVSLDVTLSARPFAL